MQNECEGHYRPSTIEHFISYSWAVRQGVVMGRREGHERGGTRHLNVRNDERQIKDQNQVVLAVRYGEIGNAALSPAG